MNRKELKVLAKLVNEFNEEKRLEKVSKEEIRIKKLEQKQLKKRIDLFNKELIEDPERFINFLSEDYEFTNAYSLEPEEIIDVKFELLSLRTETRLMVKECLEQFLDQLQENDLV